MTGGELAVVIAGRREDWPRGARTLTPREPTREPNGTLWFGADLDPDGSQVASPMSRARPGNAPPGSWPATGGPPSAAAEGRRGGSGRRTWPPSSPPATSRGAAAAASSPTPSPASAAASTP